MFSRYIKSSLCVLKKKQGFSFLNAAGIVLLACILLTTFHLKQVVQYDLKEEKELLVNTSMYRDLNCIKPFTSLVGFNWKFSKDSKRKVREGRVSAFSFSLVHF